MLIIQHWLVWNSMKAFLTMNERIGLYPIVDHYQWVEKLLKWGVRTIQLRIKEQSIDKVIDHVARSIDIASEYDAQLFINDYWQQAIKYGAFGVHLGQQDMVNADLAAINKAGLRLGLSTHSDLEMNQALIYQPSYLAFGPIYHTDSKQLCYSPQGLDQLRLYCQQSTIPVVAIGGINQQRISSVAVTGADGVAILSAISNAAEPEIVVNELLAAIG